jgi:hypothetical protein
VSTVHHGVRPAAKAARAVLGVVAFVTVAEVAHVVSVLAGPSGVIAGVAVAGVVFAACWIIFRVRPALRLARPARTCEPDAPAEIRLPARIAA